MAWFDASFGSFAPYMALLLLGFLPNEIWRWMAILFSRGLTEEMALYHWIRFVAAALVAGVVATLLIDPSGALAKAPGALRVGAIAIGLVAYALAGRSIITGVVAGQASLMAGTWWLAG